MIILLSRLSLLLLFSMSITGRVTNTTSVTWGKGDETSISPWGTPRVLDVPVSWGINSDEEDTVVKVLSTVSENTSGIEWPVGGINSYWKGSSTEIIDNGITVSFSGILKSGDMVVTTIELTGLISSGIRIWGSIGDTILNNILESLIHPTTITTLVTEWTGTINELLLGEWGSTGTLDSFKRFEGGNSWESPAWTTWTLVLNGGNLTSWNPVNGSINLIGLFFFFNVHLGWRYLKGKVSLDELFLWEIHELVGG